MSDFAAKATPSAEKLRGGYYTPEPIAAFLAAWVTAAGPRVLEPSCGDGSILLALADASADAVGVELVPGEALKAADRTGAPVEVGDFFTWFDEDRRGQYDGVAGNPPYIRFGHWADPHRARALDLMRTEGLRPNRLTNAWVPFVVASVLASRPGGRVGLVLPAELLQVGYAAELRAYLIDSCSELTIVSFRRLVFPGILQEVVLLLAERGKGPARIRTVEVDDAADLAALCLETRPLVRAPLREREKWTKYFLDPDVIGLIRRLRDDRRLNAVGQFASVDVGVVTGRNSYFVMTREEAMDRGLLDLTVPLVSRSAQLLGVTYDETDESAFEEAGGRTLLLDAQGVDPSQHESLARYIRAGEVQGVNRGYKCGIRKQWWVVPSIWAADAFMLRQIHTHPRLVANHTKATSTDTVHRLRLGAGVESSKLAAAAMNSITFIASEVLGRSYGGGILELEPSEAEELPIPSPDLLPEGLVAKVDELVRERRIEDAVDVVDQAVLIDKLGFDPGEVLAARRAWRTLRDRRANRGRRGDARALPVP